MKKIKIELESLYNNNVAKLSDMQNYINKAIQLAGEGNEIILTGKAPIWLYLAIAHALHGKAAKLIYSSPVSGEVIIFDHNPF